MRRSSTPIRVLLAVASFVALAMGLVSPGRAASTPVSVIYLKPADAATMFPAQGQDIADLGVVSVHTTAELKAAVTPEIKAIWVHRDALPQLEQEWLKGQYEAGRFIVGINLDMHQLAAALGQEASEGWVSAENYTQAFFSARVKFTGKFINAKGEPATWEITRNFGDVLRSSQDPLKWQQVITAQAATSAKEFK